MPLQRRRLNNDDIRFISTISKNVIMANSVLEDDFIFWLLLFLLCAPLAIILLAYNYYNRGKRPKKPVPDDFFYK
ncbi:MAG: hypothetical protein A4E28_00343 [Methanocella sp. PtaU1.Bin125]|nr:MAG: hypothetical protein A4E28_00343 [Methanocella sp. PtaU1.Bin125]